ncbi:putative pentatricopeptide repeat-containing protein At2g01510 [Telopea speciosissima]|uniref:putative pentatricopeptide repeat-containing protein At2g01510 n=1 Tax=Telopea speciosissima TaxID=54955 RepID=UPI001CC4856C|nr:putative pentatricopeptide repeat-containing protein At2g01510 [Telopea speciosissima]
MRTFGPNVFRSVSLRLKASPTLTSHVAVRRYALDARIIKTGFNLFTCRLNFQIEDRLKRGDISQAQQVFDGMSQRNTVSTNTLISGYVNSGNLSGARELFDRTVDRNTVTWTILIGGYAQCNQTQEAFRLFSEMRRSGAEPDQVTFITLLSACNGSERTETADQVAQVHAYVFKLGYKLTLHVCNTLVDSYCKAQCLDLAYQLFIELPQRDCVTFNAMITGYSKGGLNEQAVKLFLEMHKSGWKPSDFTFAAVLSAGIGLGDLGLGQQVHTFIFKTNFVWNVFVSNALLDFYSKHDCLVEAEKLFHEMPEMDGVSYNVLITCYAWNGQFKESLDLFQELWFTEFDHKQFPFASILGIAATLPALDLGRQTHAQVIVTSAVELDIVGTSLIDMYAKCGCLEEAQMIFAKLTQRSTVSWTAMISGYVQTGLHEEALGMYSMMHKANISSDQATFVSILRASAKLASLGLGKQLHSYIFQSGFITNVFAGSALLDMYAKCGSIKDASQIFDEMPIRNLVSWNAMISAYAQNGDGEATLRSFNEMILSGIEPDSVSFLSVLSACNHRGLVEEGLQYFDSMTEIYKLAPKREHHACMVDVLGRSGQFEKAEKFMSQMPFEPDEVMLSSVLNSCRIHRNQELAKKVAGQLFNMDLKDAAPYVIMSNIFAAAGQWDDVGKVKKSMKERGVKKVPAYSWVEIKQKIHMFSANDRSHTRMDEIRKKLKWLSGQMEKEGYKPDTSCALHNVEQELKVESLMYHSERLAIAFALISTPQGSPIRIVKNLRACIDCHAAMKVISKIEKREITVRDSSRFHHFKDGLCSCRDYW